MEEKKKLLFLLDIQLFADGEGGDDAGDAGDDNDAGKETVSKAMYDKSAAEISRLKKELKSRMTAEEQAKQVQAEKDQQIKELMDYRTKMQLISGMTESFGKESAEKIAEAIITSDPMKIAESITKAYASSTKALNDELSQLKLASMDKPGEGNNSGDGKSVTKEEFKKMNIDELIELKIKNPELYKELSK